MHLYKSEFFITFILQDLSKQCHFMIILQVWSHSIDNSRCPLYYQWLQPILLVEVRVHILLHRLNWKFALSTLDVVLYLLWIDVIDDIFQLFEWNNLLVLLYLTVLNTHLLLLLLLLLHLLYLLLVVVECVGHLMISL